MGVSTLGLSTLGLSPAQRGGVGDTHSKRVLYVLWGYKGGTNETTNANTNTCPAEEWPQTSPW